MFVSAVMGVALGWEQFALMVLKVIVEQKTMPCIARISAAKGSHYAICLIG
jgi:hypothetical protein